MTFAASTGGHSTEPKSKKPSPLVLTIIAVAVLLVLFVLFAQVFTELLWFDQLGMLPVFTTEWISKAVLFVIGFLVMAVPVWLCLWLAHRNRPIYVPVTPRQENLDRYREAVEPLRRVITIALPAVLGLLGGIALSAAWQEVLKFFNSTQFGVTDPHFGFDVSFFVFTLPVLRIALDFLGMVSLLAFLGSLVGHYLFGGIRPGEERGIHLTRTAQIQLAVTAAVLLLIQAARLFILRYENLTNSGGIVTGATYTSANITLPAMLVVSLAAVAVAVLFAANAFVDIWRLSVVSVIMLVVLGAISIIGLPAAVQQFQVQPSEQNLENEYIQRNIDGTQRAYGIDDVEIIPYQPSTEGEPGALREDAETAASIRLLDPLLVSDTFRQLQQQRAFYGFPEQLDVDRYAIDGQVEDTVIALRELNPGSQADSSWINQAVVYTHGFGVVAAYGNRQGADGQPAFLEANIPPTGELGEYEPRIYFGEQSPRYSIVGAPEGSTPREIDYPADGEDGSAQVYNTFAGDGGPSVGSFFNRLLFAIKFQDEQIVLSDALNEQSQILYDRNPRDRVQKVAPFLEVDGDPYPAVVDGKIKWIIDAYTTSAEYPYSTPQVLQEATQDSNTELGGTTQALPPQQVNYIRNSVKVTVDAFDGSVDLYEWDQNDPVLQTWMKVFPGLIQPVENMSADLMSHVRYPEDLFKVQRSLLTQYHVSDANAFYTGQDFWTLPLDPTVSSERNLTQPPYYLTLRMPTQEQSSFSLTSSFIPRPTNGQTRNNLTGFLAASADAGSEEGGPSEEYGKLRLLQLPRNTTFPGPGQAQNNFNTEPEIQTSLNLLRQGESEVQNGNLLTLPVAGGLLYVQPVYVRSAGETSYPVLQRVLVAFGEDIGFAPTLDEALDQVFGGDSGVEAGDAGQAGPADEEGAVGSTEDAKTVRRLPTATCSRRSTPLAKPWRTPIRHCATGTSRLTVRPRRGFVRRWRTR
ncbi:UPF0182 family protein [Brevibacterium daeguense]|uniref:UPF0182 protein GCM10022261_15920 n=1 Tax=Brevibacterium daeguense TaxID=909936 RepID=A0ABP8EJC3_9MICO